MCLAVAAGFHRRPRTTRSGRMVRVRRGPGAGRPARSVRHCQP